MFDLCLITASDEKQKAQFEAILDRRKTSGLYPREIDFRVIADPPGGRIGSGGALVRAIGRLKALTGRKSEKPGRVFLINAGGLSRRMPLWAPEGKIFMPLPLPSPSLHPPVLLDLQIGPMLRYPWAEDEVVVASGDVFVDFDPDFIPEHRGDVHGFAKAAPIDLGTRHGVYRFDPMGQVVTDYYQKATRDLLADRARLQGSDKVAVDTGLVSIKGEALSSLTTMADRSGPAGSLARRLDKGTVGFDLYKELLLAVLPNRSFEAYTANLGKTAMDEEDLRRVYDDFSQSGLTGTILRDARFLHFGSLAEYVSSSKALVDSETLPFYSRMFDGEAPIVSAGRSIQAWSSGNPVLETPGDTVVMMGCRDVKVEGGSGPLCLVNLNGIDFRENPPSYCAVERRRIGNTELAVAYGFDDTWKPVELENLVIFNRPWTEWSAARGINAEDVWEEDTVGDLWKARLYTASFTGNEMDWYWTNNPSPEVSRHFLQMERLSLDKIHGATDPLQRLEDHRAMRAEIVRTRILSGEGWHGIPAPEFAEIFTADEVDGLRSVYEETEDPLLSRYRNRCLRELDPGLVPASGPISVSYVAGDEYPPPKRAVQSDQIVWARAPVRLDLAGGWSDTPPFTLREGGAVLNVAVKLNGQQPLQAFCRAGSDGTIVIRSIDQGTGTVLRSFREVAAYDDPADDFAIPKAALYLSGFRDTSPIDWGRTMDAVGGGLEITLLSAVPKGSGLGTSSILAGVILAAIDRFLGRSRSIDNLLTAVLEVERLLTTGGGWQDQIGGLIGGIKLIRSLPGPAPRLITEKLDPGPFEENRDRFVLYYTGITRLAKNILSNVVDDADGMVPSRLFTMRTIRALAGVGRAAVARRDIDALGRVISESRRCNELVHPSTTNPEIESLFESTRPFTSGVKLLGAGGGGFALFLTPNESVADKLRNMIKTANKNSRAVDFDIDSEGLVVSVS